MSGQPWRPDEVPFYATPGGGLPSATTSWSAGPSAPVRPVAPLRPVREVTSAVLALSFVVAGLSAVEALTAVLAVVSDVGVALDGLATVGLALVQVATLVVVAVWLSRARANATLITPSAVQRRASAWTWLGWFFPVAFLFVPFQVVSDVWTASRHRALPGSAPRLGLWWGLWLASLFLDRAASRLADGGALGATLTVVSTGLLLGALPLWIGVVRSISAAQRP